jgi:hypothetical protein
MKYLNIAVISAVAALSSPAFAAPGESFTVGSVQTPNNLTATFTDHESGQTYNFFLEAQENGGNVGNTTFGLMGTSSACTLHGGQPRLAPSTTPFSYGGSAPYSEPGCGTAYSQNISIHGCVLNIQAHGFIHSDAPNIAYLGSSTIEVRYQKSKSSAQDEIQVTLNTAKEEIKLSGKVTSTGGLAAVMPSCK